MNPMNASATKVMLGNTVKLVSHSFKKIIEKLLDTYLVAVVQSICICAKVAMLNCLY